jgi:transposase
MTHLTGHDAHLSPRQREQIIRLHAAGNLTQREIAEHVDVDQSTVSRTLSHFAATGDLHEHVAGGHPMTYDDDDLYRLDCIISQHSNATADTLLQLMGTSAPQVSSHTIAHYRHVLDYSRRRPAEWEVDTERTVALRTVWVAEHKADDHRRWVYMDESTLCLRHSGDFVWVKRGEDTPVRQLAMLRCHVNVWGAVWDDGAVFSFYTGSLTTEAYTTVLEAKLSRYKRHLSRRTFLHDGASAHRAQATNAWFQDQHLVLLQLPPHSPQFNAIEEVWSWIKHKVRQAQPTSSAELGAACQHAWEELPQETVRAFIQHVHNNIQSS